MSRRQLAILVLALSAGGCAAAAPGYQPPSPKLDKIRAAAPTGGGFDAAGTYSLTDQERQLDCKRLTGSMSIKIVQMRDAVNRPRPSAIAANAQALARPIVGGTTYGQDIEADLKRDRARLDALNGQLAAKKCPTFDIDADLAPGNTNPPRPVKAQRKA
ncbi:MAG: hypothetical protein AB7O57_11705 [Hyphomicrobiaceae bacterium]